MLTPLLGKYPASALLLIANGPVPRHDHQHRPAQGYRRHAGRVGFALSRARARWTLRSHRDEGAAARHHGDRQSAPRLSLLSGGPAPGSGRASASLPASPMDCPAIHADRLVPVTMAFVNPAMFLPVIMKSVMLASRHLSSARGLPARILGATFVGGLAAILFWFALKLCASLWMFFLLMLLARPLLRGQDLRRDRQPPSAAFWQDVTSTSCSCSARPSTTARTARTRTMPSRSASACSSSSPCMHGPRSLRWNGCAAPPSPPGRKRWGPGVPLMLRNLLIGVGAMTLCLLLQSALLVQALRYFARRDSLRPARLRGRRCSSSTA